MTKRMLIDATHAEETRVVVLDGNRLEDFDVETSTKRQLKGNIYLAKVVRVEPSLQAAFVEYGGNRHGFLAFDEIHPDYYQIPVADRERLLAMQAEQVRREEEAEAEREEQGAEAAGDPDPAEAGDPHDRSPVQEEPDSDPATPPGIEAVYRNGPESVEHQVDQPPAELATIAETGDESGATEELLTGSAPPNGDAPEGVASIEADAPPAPDADRSPDGEADPDADADSGFDRIPELPPPETVGGEHDTVEEARERRIPPRFLRNYKIQEVIRRRQILLVQVVKEERGTKGAALTTYISLAGRYCVLMPNSPRGGGISRKITSAADRRRLKEVTAELDLPDGMGLIVRTAGANRPKPEIKRDCEYLLRLWDDIREHTMRSVAPALIYEEASLIKRAIRDVYSRDIDEITVDGEAGWRAARDFMRMLMPSHVKKVQLWRDPGSSVASAAVASAVGGQPLFSRHQVDAQLDAVLSPTVQLRSGGYLVINQAEALVAIDVNSGRSTRERGIEETALRTNLEAADEVARQLRLRDLAGLIVIDFIDMESKKHNAMVERRLKDALKTDRARIQVGHISHFGLLEMSRQRLRPSLAETSFVLCAHCGGTGHVRSTESAAIHVLRGIEEEAAKHRAAEVLVHAATSIEMYIFNHKRDRLAEIETRYGMRVAFAADDALISPQFRIERLRVQTTPEAPVAITAGPGHALPPAAEPEEPTDDAPAIVTDAVEPAAPASDEAAGQPTIEAGAEASAAESAEEAERHRRRRRRRRRSGRRDDAPASGEAPAMPIDQDMPEAHLEGVPEHADPATSDDEGARRRGRRGRRRRRDGETLPEIAAPGAEQPELLHTGPTPANPFGSHGFDIFDVLEQAEQRSAGPPTPVLPVIARPPTAESVPAEPVPAESVPAGVSADIEPEPAGFDDAPFESPPASAVPGALPTADELPDLEPEPPDAAIAPEPAPSAPTATEPEPPAPANDREPEPTVRPIVIGVEDEPAAEKKRGWWRR